MPSLVNYACILVPVALHLMLPSVAFRRCGSVYRGFAQCLMSLGDSLTENAQRDEHIHSICRSWDEFHACATVAMAACPEEAAAVWASLRHESRKTQFSGNLYDMCAGRSQPDATAQAPPPSQEDINQESLKAHAHYVGSHAHLLLLLTSCLLLLLLPWI